MRNIPTEKVRKDIVRIRLPGSSAEKLESMAAINNMEIPDLTRFVMSSLSLIDPANFHRAITAMVDTGMSDPTVNDPPHRSAESPKGRKGKVSHRAKAGKGRAVSAAKP